MFSINFLRNQCRLKPNDVVVAGISGGADSLYLLYHLHEIGQPVIAAVFNHQLRPEAEEEVVFVQNICEKLGIHCITGAADVYAFSKLHKLSLEEAARISRYQFLFRTAKDWEAAAVAVAHHADDQVETILMHFLRGSGLDGLAGMNPITFIRQWDPDRKIPLIRPILPVWRQEIDAWCKENKIQPVQDTSNSDTTYFRNQLRHQLIPELEECYSPQFKQHLQDMSQTIQEDQRIIHDAVNVAWSASIIYANSEKQQIVFDRARFSNQLKGIQTRLLRKAFFMLQSDSRDFSFFTSTRVLEFLKNAKENDAQPFINHLWMAVEDGLFLIYAQDRRPNIRKFPQTLYTPSTLLNLPGEVPLETGRIIGSVVDFNPQEFDSMIYLMKNNRSIVYLDSDKIALPLYVRNAKRGETFSPLGSNGHTQKISDFFINQKIPKNYRGLFPLVSDQNAIIWIPGYRPAEFCHLTADTKHCLCLIWEPQ